MHKFQRAFTIVELLVVIVIIGILATVVITAFNGISGRAKDSALSSDLTQAKKQIEAFYAVNGVYPTANNCTNTAATEICLKTSPGNTLTYTFVSNTASPAYNLEGYLTSSSLYDFASVTFTNGGQTGPSGPSTAQVTGGISGNTWKTNTSYLTTSSGIILWTVPKVGSYRITVAGAKGGNSTCYGPVGGYGATMIGTFDLTRGETIKLVVGQMGGDNCYDAGGGGGSFVVKANNTPLIIAAGGGGASYSGFSGSGGKAGGTGTSGSSTSWTTGGSNGSGGGGYTTGGGGGFNGNGTANVPGLAFINGATGGAASYGAAGGFGGGGGGGGTYGAGGGGGYSGGGASPWSYDAGGGGSYNTGTTPSNTGGNNSSHGYITIQLL